MLRKLFIITVMLMMGFQMKAQLDETDTGAIIKASYIYNFAKLVDWTESKDAEILRISIIGESNLYKQLTNKYSGKKIGNQTVEINFILEEDEFSDIHILYVARKKKDLIPSIVKKLNGKNTLLITESEGALNSGSVINFISVNNVLKFEINQENAAEHNLLIGSTLIGLAE